MAASSVTTTIAGQLSTRKDVLSVTSSGGNNVVAVDTGSGTLLDQVKIDNTAGTSQVYLRIWDTAAGSVTAGTTAPAIILTAAAGEEQDFSFIPAPVLDNALTAQLTTTSGYTASGTATSWVVTVTFLTH